MAFLETGAFVGLVAPGETTVLVGGLVAGQGEIDIVVLIALVWMCAVAGDVTSYFLGRRLGRAFLVRHGPRVKITEERITQVEGFFERRGGITILIGRFIGLVRALAPFIAGASRMPPSKFLPYDIVGAGAWAATFSLLGYIFWRSFDKVANYVGTGLFAFGASVAVIVGVFLLARIIRHPERRRAAHAWVSEQAQRPWLRPLARVLRPLYYRACRPLVVRLGGPARFAIDRLTPGQLGLELTTALALLAVGAYATVVLFRQVGPGPPPFVDREGYKLVGSLQTDFLVDLFKVVSHFGRIEVVGAIVVLTALWAAWRGRWEEAVGLVAGLLLTAVLVDFVQDARDRLRPPGSLVATTTPSYPSGHAAFVVAFVPSMVVLIRAGSGLAGALRRRDRRARPRSRGRGQPHLPARALGDRRDRRPRPRRRLLRVHRHRRPDRRPPA